ncbi:MAG TPA: hypothetical protein VNT26_07885, partial [Candidatus Sulfotelmatobacter sp.]|nr:hypothetical protein [Candidatus Sulfotelmatobacter sp.]
AHTTKMAGLVNIKGGDDRFYNNLFVGKGEAAANDAARLGLWVYDKREYALLTGGNLFYNGARPYAKATSCVTVPTVDPHVKLVEEGNQLLLQLNLGPELRQPQTRLVTTALLGQARIPGLPYENADGSPLKLDSDFFGKKRPKANPTPGPFEKPGNGELRLRVR